MKKRLWNNRPCPAWDPWCLIKTSVLIASGSRPENSPSRLMNTFFVMDFLVEEDRFLFSGRMSVVQTIFYTISVVCSIMSGRLTSEARNSGHRLNVWTVNKGDCWTGVERHTLTEHMKPYLNFIFIDMFSKSGSISGWSQHGRSRMFKSNFRALKKRFKLCVVSWSYRKTTATLFSNEFPKRQHSHLPSCVVKDFEVSLVYKCHFTTRFLFVCFLNGDKKICCWACDQLTLVVWSVTTGCVTLKMKCPLNKLLGTLLRGFLNRYYSVDPDDTPETGETMMSIYWTLYTCHL